MHVDATKQQIRIRHVLGDRGKPDTLSLKSFGLSGRDFQAICKRVEAIQESQRNESEHLRQTFDWLESIPRKLHKNLYDKLLRFDPQFAVTQETDLTTCVGEYESFRQRLDTSVGTDAAVMRDVQRLLDRCPSDVTRIDDEVLVDVLAQLADEYDYSRNTSARIAKHWSSFFRWLIDRGSIAINPCVALDKSMTRKEKDEVKQVWVDQIMALPSMSIEDRYWLSLVHLTGCRLREGLSLRAKDIDPAKKRITFTESKNDRLRINPLYPEIAAYYGVLSPKLDPDDRVLERITQATCYGWLRDKIDRCGLPHWSPPYNAFRATRVNQLTKEIGPAQAGLLLGHSATVAKKNYLSVEDSLLDSLSKIVVAV